MDDMTKRLWAAEFERQYPRPVRVAATDIDHIAAADAYADARIAVMEALDGKEMGPRERNLRWEGAGLRYFENLPKQREVDSWEQWRNECRDRFAAIYAAEPLHALAALRDGDLLIEPVGSATC
jgi:hypothetical protein